MFNSDKSVQEIIKLGFAIRNKKWLITFCNKLFVYYGRAFNVFVGTYIIPIFMMLPTYLIHKYVVGFEDAGVVLIEDVKF